MKIWHIFARPAAVLTAAAAIWSCGLFDGIGKHDEINYLPDYVYTDDDRAILGTTKEIRIGQVLISPEIYVGEQKMDISVRQEDTESGTVTVISVHFPDTITDEMYSGGIEGQYCRLVLKSEVEGMEGTYNDIIAWIRLYEKTVEFIDGMTVGNPVTAETDGAYCIYLNDSDEKVIHDNSYHTPMKITGENPERLTFLDEDGNTLQDVNMRYISKVYICGTGISGIHRHFIYGLRIDSRPRIPANKLRLQRSAHRNVRRETAGNAVETVVRRSGT